MNSGTEWKWAPHGREWIETTTTILPYDRPNVSIVHFFAHDEVRVVVSNYWPESAASLLLEKDAESIRRLGEDAHDKSFRTPRSALSHLPEWAAFKKQEKAMRKIQKFLSDVRRIMSLGIFIATSGAAHGAALASEIDAEQPPRRDEIWRAFMPRT